MTVGIVVIGRNEGEHLRACLHSVCNAETPVVYADSGSSDDSVAIARSFGVDVVELDPARPFSAARGRNEGFALLQKRHPAIEFVQFVDGDCEVIADWIPAAKSALTERRDLAIVTGYLHESRPGASIYNRLGDLEWNFAGAGEVDAVGGIFMIRRTAMEKVGGFDLTVTAGEEPELCQRLRSSGWRILRLDRRMALHDLDMNRFGQWWRRQIRSGHGGLDVAKRFGLVEFRRMTRRARFWSAWPLLVAGGWLAGSIAGSVPAQLAAMLVFALWPTQLLRIALRTWRAGQPPAVAIAYAWFTMLSFWPQMLGQWRYLSDRGKHRQPLAVESGKASTVPEQHGCAPCRSGTGSALS